MEQVKKAVSAAKEDQVSRKLLVWLNTFPDKPVDLIRFEFLPAETECMMVLVAVLVHGEEGRSCGRLNADYPAAL